MNFQDNGLDMELEPETVALIRQYRDGNDRMSTPNALEVAARKLSDDVYKLSNRKKGLIILDLLTLTDCLSQAVVLANMPPDPDEEKP